MVFAELAGDVAEGLEHVCDGRVFGLKAKVGAGQPYFGQAGADGRLAGDKCSAASGAALLSVPVGKERAFFSDAIDVGRAIAHYAQVVSADIEPPNVIAPDDQNVRFVCHSSVSL